MVADTVVVTAEVVTVNVADDAPEGTATVAGTVTPNAPHDRFTTTPAAGAGPLRVTVPVAEAPPVTVLGDSVTAVSVGGRIVNLVDWTPEPRVAVIVTAVDEATGDV